MQVHGESSLFIAKCVLALIAQECSSIISIREVSLVPSSGEDIFDFGHVRLMDDHVQIAEFSERHVPVDQLRQDDALERCNRNTILLKYAKQSQKLSSKQQACLYACVIKTFQFELDCLRNRIPTNRFQVLAQHGSNAMALSEV